MPAKEVEFRWRKSLLDCDRAIKILTENGLHLHNRIINSSVKRYAHLSPNHMKQEVEAVASFGQEGNPGGKQAEPPPSASGTVIKPEIEGRKR
jgi:hypothetical protein